MYSNIPFFISDVSNLCPLFFLVSLTRGLSILLIVSKNQLLVSLIYCIDFLFSIPLNSALILILSSAYFGFNFALFFSLDS